MRHRLPQVLALCIAGAGVFRAWTLRWVGDDIFITLRYVDNFVAGHGWVYNIGERVEGYTHFLWLVILTAVKSVGLDALTTTHVLGLLSYAGVIGLLFVASRRLIHQGARWFIPLTPLVLVVHYDFQVWATGGLETMFFTFLVTAAFVGFFATSFSRSKRLALSGVALALATLTRPDGIIFVALGTAFVVASHIVARSRVRSALTDVALINAGLACLLLPFLLWRLSFYGDFFPNTYYAKMAYSTHYDQGLYYLLAYLRAYVTTFLIVLVPVALIAFRRRSRSAISSAALVIAFSAVFVYLFVFVVRIGGDFMYARFIVPVIPLIYFAIEATLVTIIRTRAFVVVSAMILLSVGFAEHVLRDQLLLEMQDGNIVTVEQRGIVDEMVYYKNTYPIDRERAIGEELAPYFAGLDATVLLRGQACFGYYANFRRCIEATGLTDRHIAHLPVEERGRIGHEKRPDLDYLVDEGVDFLFRRAQYKEDAYRVVGFRVLGDLAETAELITYDRTLIAELAKRFGDNWRYTNFEDHLDRYIAQELPSKPLEDLRADYDAFRDFYFRHNDDDEREAAFTDRLDSLAGE